ncbi:MAG: glycosyltransferase family 4 protein, partial [Fimbriimonadaceae bacterium]
IPNPVEMAALAEEVPRRLEALFVGSWIERKGTREMVGAVPRFLNQHREWTFRIVGADDPAAVRSAFPAELGDRVVVEGVVRDRLDVARRMAAATLIVLPSHFESYGLVVAEAVLQGCVPVTTPVGLGAELTDGVTGFVFPPRDAEALVTALQRAASASADERAAIAARTRALIEDRTWERAGEAMDGVLRRVAGA